MKGKYYYIAAINLLLLFSINAFAYQNIPIKTYPVIDIPDGEYLHYANYIGKEKDSDFYYVTKKLTNNTLGFFYRTYFYMIHVSKDTINPGYYKNWPAYFDTDPKLGSVIESEGKFSAGVLKNSPFYGDLIYWHYQLNREKNEVDYISRSLKNGVTNESKCRVKFNTDVPSVNFWSATSFTARFLDFKRGGFYYLIIPELLKGPLPCSWKFISKDHFQSKAGYFNVIKLTTVLADPFLGNLMNPFLKGADTVIEDSDKRRVVQSGSAGFETILEEVSNVNR